MGVSYSAAVGYGFGVPEEQLEDMATEIGYEWKEEWGFEADSFLWSLVEGTFLTYDLCGDFMNGEGMYASIAARSQFQSWDLYSWDGNFNMIGLDSPTLEEQIELEDVFRKLHGRSSNPGEVGWFMSTTIG